LGLATAFVVAFTIAVTRSEPPLPTVKISASTNIEGKLVAHAERFWYVFDEQGNLVALPEQNVTEVRISATR